MQANTYIATVLGITENEATPVFVEPDQFYNIDSSKIEEAITDKTKAIMVVHLYGQATNMTNISKIANKYNLKIIEDCAQSHGAKYNGTMTGAFGELGCFSFYPTKNLGAFGDQDYLADNDIKTAIHYPIPPHLAECYSSLSYKKMIFQSLKNMQMKLLAYQCLMV